MGVALAAVIVLNNFAAAILIVRPSHDSATCEVNSPTFPQGFRGEPTVLDDEPTLGDSRQNLRPSIKRRWRNFVGLLKQPKLN